MKQIKRIVTDKCNINLIIKSVHIRPISVISVLIIILFLSINNYGCLSKLIDKKFSISYQDIMLEQINLNTDETDVNDKHGF